MSKNNFCMHLAMHLMMLNGQLNAEECFEISMLLIHEACPVGALNFINFNINVQFYLVGSIQMC